MDMFNEIGLSEAVIKATINMGFEEPTPIQAQTIPLALKGEDVIGQAQTGTGKTAAFGIPMVEKMTSGPEYIQGLVVAPTRELAIQVAEELNKIGQFKRVRALPIYGGQDINYQIRALKNRPQIIVGTPGRLMDHMRRRTIRLHNVEIVVLDEADEMLNMGFIEDIENILKEVPTERQTLLFSATMPKPIQTLAQQFMINPTLVSIKNKEVTVPDTRQYYIEVQERQKFDLLCRLLDIQSPESAIIFGRTKRRVDELCEALNTRGYSVEGLHGDLNQSKRDSVLRHFREGTTEILVATDVAARGLDIPGVTHIYNFDVPQDPEGYVHRIGRTGRAGKSGLAVTFVTPREMGQLRLIEQAIRKRIDRKPIPTFLEVVVGQQKQTVEKLLNVVEEEDLTSYRELAEELLADNDSITLIAAALKLLTKEPNTTPVKITEEAPLRVKKQRNFNTRSDHHRKWDGNRGYKKPQGRRQNAPQKPNKKDF
ncbi:DEAD/DEAH box helicase [Dehalobacterium formicoaceticum]|uniref:DEAD/DEAH box helicase n=1 Tax=Dehalobacterium formicoaceticum TaxID=51515 RepID=UPI0031F6198B